MAALRQHSHGIFMHKTRLPSLTEILILTLLLLAIIFVAVHQLGLPIQLAFIGCWFVVMGFGKYLGYHYHHLQKGGIAGFTQGMDAIMILKYDWKFPENLLIVN